MANVFNKTTKRYLKSVNTADYLDGNWIINPDLSALSEIPKKYWKVDGESVVEMTQAEKDVVDGDELVSIKARKRQQIDVKTQSMIFEGFEFDGHTFSLSQYAQLNWNTLKTAHLGGLLTFPHQVSTMDDSAYNIMSEDDFNQFIGIGLTKGVQILASGRVIKVNINNATTAAEVAAIEDTR